MKNYYASRFSEIPGISVVESFANNAVFVFLILYALFFSLVGILRYNFFDFGDFDLAVYSQALWNISHGSIFSSILGVPFLAGHTALIIFLIWPFYFLAKTPILLLILQTIAIALSGYLLYRLASSLLNKTWAFVLFILYLMYPPLIYASIFEFHPVTLSIPFLFLSFLAYKNENFFHFLFYSILAMLCKENIPLIIAMFGILALVDRKSIKWIAAPLLLGSFFFIVLIFVIKPYFNKGIIDFFILYREFGNTPKDIILNMISSPYKVMVKIFSIENFRFTIKLIGPVVFLPLFSLTKLLPVTLVFLQHLLSSRITEKMIVYHYSAKFVPFIFISATYGLKRLFAAEYIKKLGKFITPLLLTLLLGVSFCINMAIGKQVLNTLYKIPHFIKRQKENSIKQKFINMIPEDAAVVSTFRFLPKLSQRKNLYSFHHIYMGLYTLSNKIYPLPKKLDYALIDFNNQFTFNFRKPNSYENLRRFFNSYNWEVVDFDGSTVLFKNSRKHNLSKLFRILKEDPKTGILVNGKINDEIELIGLNWIGGQDDKAGEIRLSFYWRCLKETSNSYNSFLGLVNVAGEFVKVDKKYMCYRIYPTHQWQKDEIIREDYWYILPSKLSKGKYYFKLGMLEENTRNIIKIVSDKKELFDKEGFLVFLKFEKAD